MFCLALYIISVPLYVLIVYPLFSCSTFFSFFFLFGFHMCLFCLCPACISSEISSSCFLLCFLTWRALWLLFAVHDAAHSLSWSTCKKLSPGHKIECFIETVNYTLHWWIHRVVNLPLTLHIDEIKSHAAELVSDNVLLAIPDVF